MCLMSVAYCFFIKSNFIALLIREFRAFTMGVIIMYFVFASYQPRLLFALTPSFPASFR